MSDGLEYDALPPADFVAETAVPEGEEECWVHFGHDEHYHPYGGYWFPSGTDFRGDHSGVVRSKSDIPSGEMTQYPCEDRPPETDNGEHVQDRTLNVHVDATIWEVDDGE